ncbi:hypothetical protein ACJRO7_026599 [Eucalyptus globulus]|uniref:Peroxidase n=1 Tax=Eucalyptus globulus TaxID=34317 RepID=A0ABD3JPE5_EUCGL
MEVLASSALFFVALHLVSAAVQAGGLLGTVPIEEYGLSFQYYQQSCPQFEAVVGRKVKEWIKDYTLAPALMRLHFLDCVVRGSERSAEASKTLRGFEIIDDIKTELEKSCLRTASCVDSLATAARDATVSAGGPYWMVPYGCKDGRVSVAGEADKVPMGHENITSLLQLFQSQGLNVLDLVVLSGAHTIGRRACRPVQSRLYNYKSTGKPDPTRPDPTFDNAYYKNLQRKTGLLSTDQYLYSDSRTGPLMAALATQPNVFNYQFGVSMAKLGNVQVLTGDEGEVRTDCNAGNRY